jgi:hypothetical protein
MLKKEKHQLNFLIDSSQNGRIQGRFDTIHQGLPQPPLGVD